MINGVPVFLVETKAAHKLEGIAEALDQVRRYHQQSSEMLAMLQVYALTHIVQLYYSATWNTTQKLLYNWKDESAGNNYEALAIDSQDIEGMADDVKLLKERFDELIKEAKESYLKITEGKHKDKAIEAILEYFYDSKRREAFYEFYKELADIFDIVSPDKFLRPFLEDYEF